ncbi:MAG: preprotein translocase subunit YajC [Treponema sp.]|nr:preprotein translocase subunit YajC [Treponema sp.]MCL2237349.1 preprotein translocase subunit YajC [Treponema sp.]
MDSFILPLLMGASQGAAEGNNNAIMGLLPFVFIILIFYFLIIRPQNKKRKETEKMLSELKKGDKIVTIGGLYGTIQSVKETTVIIKADDNVKLEFLRSAISSVTQPSAAKEEKIEDKTEEKSEEKSEEEKEQA